MLPTAISSVLLSCKVTNWCSWLGFWVDKVTRFNFQSVNVREPSYWRCGRKWTNRWMDGWVVSSSAWQFWGSRFLIWSVQLARHIPKTCIYVAHRCESERKKVSALFFSCPVIDWVTSPGCLPFTLSKMKLAPIPSDPKRRRQFYLYPTSHTYTIKSIVIKTKNKAEVENQDKIPK